MKFSRLLVLTGALVAALAVPLSTSAFAATSSVGFSTDGGYRSSNYGQYKMTLQNSWFFDVMKQTKAAGSIPIVYKDLTSVRTDDGALNGNMSVPGSKVFSVVNNRIVLNGVRDSYNTATGVGFAWAWRYHPEWFLTYSGKTATHATPYSDLARENGFPTQFIVNWGNATYQQVWARNVIANAKARGYHWVFADNALDYAKTYLKAPLPKYPTNAAVQSATLSALKYITKALNAAGIKIIYNVGYTSMFDHSNSDSLFARWLPYTNGICNEFGATYQGYSGDVAFQKSETLRLHKVSIFGHSNGIEPTFDIVGSPS
jgi:hypothetical protein